MPPDETTAPQMQDNGGAPDTGAPPAQQAPPAEEGAWRNVLPKEYREDANFSKFKSIGDLAKSYRDLSGLLGREPRVPAKDAPPDQWTQFYTALGRPDTPDKYQLPVPSAEDGGPEIIPEVLEGFRKSAHEAGLTNSQAHKLTEWYFNVLNGQADALAAETAGITERAERELKRELGNAYEPKLMAATKIFNEFGGKDLLDWMEASGAGSNPHLIRMAIKVADAMSEDRLGASRPASFGHTPAEAQREIGRLNLDKEFQTALYDGQHPGHADAVRRRSELYAAAYPTEDPNVA